MKSFALSRKLMIKNGWWMVNDENGKDVESFGTTKMMV